MKDLHVVETGMVTAVGLDAKSACAAMRGRIDGFAETRFISSDGEPLVGAAVPLPRNWVGAKRLAHLAAGAIVEILRKRPSAKDRLELILCLSEPSRIGKPIAIPAEFAKMLREIAQLPPETKVRIVEHGRPSGVVALTRAEQALKSGAAKNVIIIGVDSYLTGGSIGHFLAAERILTTDVVNGFLPGEAAGAILCSHEENGLRLCGSGLAREQAHIYNAKAEDGLDLPLRGDGMTSAYKDALEASRTSLDFVEYRISDLIGEKFFFKQATLASQRLMRERHEQQELWSPGESLGNIGAAVVPVMIGMALVAARKGYAYGDPVLIESSADDGACAAAVFQYRVPAMSKAA